MAFEATDSNKTCSDIDRVQWNAGISERGKMNKSHE